MERQGLIQAFGEAAGRRLVPLVQLSVQRRNRPSGLGVGRPVIRALEALPPHHLLALGQVAHHVLALVPLTPLH